MPVIEAYALVGDKLVITLKPVEGAPVVVDVAIPAAEYTEAGLKRAIEAALERRLRDLRTLGILKAMKDAKRL